MATNSQLAAQLNITERTVRLRCSEIGIRSRIPVEEDLSAAQKEARVRWARVYRDNNFMDWEFSDESAFELANLSIPRRQIVHRKSTEKHAEFKLEGYGIGRSGWFGMHLLYWAFLS